MLCMMNTQKQEKYSRVELGDMSKSKLKKNSYFQHVSHASYKDRDRSCIISVCVTSTEGDWVVPSHTLAQEILAENKGCL